MSGIKVTITAALEAEKNTLNFYGAHNLSRETLRFIKDNNLNHVTIHVFSKDEAMRVIDFCARNNLEYRLGGPR
jgi:arabinogalactan endo-1,4-beta-galactosidase